MVPDVAVGDGDGHLGDDGRFEAGEAQARDGAALAASQEPESEAATGQKGRRSGSALLGGGKEGGDRGEDSLVIVLRGPSYVHRLADRREVGGEGDGPCATASDDDLVGTLRVVGLRDGINERGRVLSLMVSRRHAKMS